MLQNIEALLIVSADWLNRTKALDWEELRIVGSSTPQSLRESWKIAELSSTQSHERMKITNNLD